jgi:hypothetical protein
LFDERRRPTLQMSKAHLSNMINGKVMVERKLMLADGFGSRKMSLGFL